eukprot:CAMPEP_0204247226 /NCGR_PEP_ID=MMETSP0361-20130328/98540_1 /ASSEMBLY_ACC=CAM_ASM_000343 /TAXON_ID=268821 /ORGANISM="Scrippsiella Hangoei, Strain SHTV-5" /LENGTH=998 /DNA_ID=CAMNT_0051220459 /DNA_START=80 /DNA_END=3077 /DNA_ORIENTATION=+
MQGPSVATSMGVAGWNYNRANFKYDQGQRWQRYTTGRKMAMAQVGMFRQDITDLAGASMAKLKVYGPIYGIVITVCVTVFVEGRSGLKFPGPPVFISQIYLQCLGVGMSFMALATWLLFHASMRAQVACVQLRTRKVRVPVPTQRQLDGSRKLLSNFEEQGLYDIFRVPFMMPNGANSQENSDEEEEEGKQHKGYAKGGIPGIASKVRSMAVEAHEKGHTTHNMGMPGLTSGHPSWYETELEQRDDCPESSPSGFGKDGAPLPYEHFEMLREAQKEWWACEAYMRICFLYGMMHLIMAFSYWITLHNICELGMIWCSNLGAAGLTAGVWIMFRMDVLPEHGGAFPVEIGGPFVTSIALGMMYGHTVNQTMMDIARGIAAFIILMHVALCFRMYSVAKPAMTKAHHQAKEAGGRLFNNSGSCDSPAWLPSAFQHVMYLVAPPKTVEQLEKEQHDRDNNAIADDPLAKVDMTPWSYLRTMIFIVALGWVVQLTGHAIECVMGERMLMSNPGQPPWSRAGQWYGWEHGPVSSKHYAHVTPQRGHWAWQKGWGPQGQQELWASDMFGFAPEADAWWSEPEGPEPLQGAAGFGENSWAKGTIAYGQNEPKWGPQHAGTHSFDNNGGHRRLAAHESSVDSRPVVPVPVQWPAAFEPDHLACGPHSAGTIDMFGFAPEADAWWSEPEGPEPLQGAAGFGENSWAKGTIAYGQNEPKWGPKHTGKHDFDANGGHRRLATHESSEAAPRPVVPVPVQWPALLEPDFLVCGHGPEGGRIAALTASGLGALLPVDAADGRTGASAVATSFAAEGLLELGMAHSATWGDSSLLIVTGSGNIACCSMSGSNAEKSVCRALPMPPLLGRGTRMAPSAILEVTHGRGLRAFVAGAGGRVAFLELSGADEFWVWSEVGAVQLPQDAVAAALSAANEHLLVTSEDGKAFLFDLLPHSALPASEFPSRTDSPAAGPRRTWQSACVLPGGRILRLASSWQRERGSTSAPILRPELLV